MFDANRRENKMAIKLVKFKKVVTYKRQLARYLEKVETLFLIQSIKRENVVKNKNAASMIAIDPVVVN